MVTTDLFLNDFFLKKEDVAFLHKENVVGHYDGFIRALFSGTNSGTRALCLATSSLPSLKLSENVRCELSLTESDRLLEICILNRRAHAGSSGCGAVHNLRSQA